MSSYLTALLASEPFEVRSLQVGSYLTWLLASEPFEVRSLQVGPYLTALPASEASQQPFEVRGFKTLLFAVNPTSRVSSYLTALLALEPFEVRSLQ